MNYVDIAIIAIIAIFALLGLWKGFAKTGIKLICFALAVLVTWALAGYVVRFVVGIGFVRKFVVGDEFSLASVYYKQFCEGALAGATADTRLDGAMGLFVNPMIQRYAAMGGPEAYGGMGYDRFVSIMLAINTISIVLCLIVYAVVRVVAHILAWILKKIFVHGKGVKVWSRLVGFVLGAGRGIAIVMVLLIISTALFPFSFAKSYTDSVGNGIIAKSFASFTYKASDGALYGGKKTQKTEKLLEVAGYLKDDPSLTPVE